METVHVAAAVSALHLLALGLGLPSVFLRGRALRGTLDGPGLSRLFAADTVWSIAAVLWVVTGPLRAFGGIEKGTQFYLSSQLFWVKMGFFVGVVLLEIWPMVTFIRWRTQIRHGKVPNMALAPRLYLVNQVQLAMIIAIVFTASLMARGVSFGV